MEEQLIKYIIGGIIGIGGPIYMLFVAHERKTKKYIIIAFISCIIFMANTLIHEYIILNPSPLVLIGLLAFISFIFFTIKAIISDRKVKK